MHCPGHRLSERLSLGLGSLATGSCPATDLVQRRWPIGEERKGIRPGRLAMKKAAINAVIFRVGHKKGLADCG